MAKSFPAHKVKSHLVFTVWEVADVLGCHRQTVIRWIGNNGLAADTSSKPWLIEGHVLKEFLGQRQRKARCKLTLHHCYCLSCRGPREPDGKIADYVQETAFSGRLTALCPTCDAVMNKIIRRSDLEAIQAKVEVTLQQASPRLVSCTEPHSKVTLKEEPETHVKTHLGYLRDTEVTILLCGTETKGRKYVDWELKSSMINTRLNSRSGILVVALPSVYNNLWLCSMKDEKSMIYPDYKGGWTSSKSLSEYRERYPYLPERIVDNMYNPNARISIVPWERTKQSPESLRWLVDNAAQYGKTNEYDLTRTMRRRNAPMQTNALASFSKLAPRPPSNALANILADRYRR